MKIIHILPSLRKGGAERLVLDIIKNVSKQKEIELRLVIFREEIEYDISEIKRLIDVVPCSVQLSLTKKWQVNVSGLQQFLNEFNPDIIHTHLFESELVSRFCVYPKAIWFTHVHDNMIQIKNLKIATISKSAITNFFEKKVLFNRYKKNGGTHFITISKHTESYIKSVQTKYSVTLLHNAIDIERFKKPFHSESQPINWPEERRRNPSNIDNLPLFVNLINIGSFVPKKNQIFLLDVIIELNKKGVKVSCLYLGDGALKNEVKQRGDELGITNQCQFLGNVEKVEEYLWRSDIYVHTATYEPLGLVLLEAMACGLPVVCTDGQGNRDLIQEGENGFMVWERNPKLLADKIELLLKNEDLRLEMGEKARTFAQEFGMENYVKELLSIYKS
jgi:glycosyltransferase involved in cell wall biosynthesis